MTRIGTSHLVIRVVRLVDATKTQELARERVR
jgi:hypothetical protein